MTLDAARERLALLVTLLGLSSFLSLGPTTSTEALVAVAALAAAAVGGRRPLVLTHAAPGRLLTARPPAAVPLVLAGRTTDVVHHPARPRAPGLV